MNLAKHTFHTRSAEVFGLLIRLNLTVVRLASGFPGLVRASPSLFIRWVPLQVFGQRQEFGF